MMEQDESQAAFQLLKLDQPQPLLPSLLSLVMVLQK